MKTLNLPTVPGLCERWKMSPVWIRVHRTLHAVVWMHPDVADQQETRWFLTRKGILEFDGSDEAKAEVACCKRDAVGIVSDLSDSSCKVCSRCANVIQRPSFSFWSKQLADLRIAQLRDSAIKRECHTLAWAIGQVDTSNEAKCLTMLNEIADRAPNNGARLFQPGLIIGRPTIVDNLQPSDWARLF